MPFAVVLFFDPRANAAVREIGKKMEDHDIPFALNRVGADPHISLAGFKERKGRQLRDLLKKIAGKETFLPFRFSKAGVFRKAGVLFLNPGRADGLLKIHADLHRRLRGLVRGTNPHYSPKNWVPHCTLGMGLSPNQLRKALKIVGTRRRPIRGVCRRIALVKYYPVKNLFSFKLQVSPEGNGRARRTLKA